MTPEFVSEVIEESGADIKEAIRKQVIDSVANNLKWSIESHVNDVIKKYLEEEINPEVLKILTANRGAILKSVETSLADISEQISAALKTKAVKNLSDSYNTSDLVKAIFGNRY